MSYKGIPKTSQIVYTGAGPLDEKSYVESIADLSNLDTNYLVNGQSVFCTENGGHYIYLPSGCSTATAPTVGSWYLWEQIEFDARYKVGSHQICFSEDDLPQPISPATCTWEIDSSVDSKALWADSTQTMGTILAGSLPKIEGACGTFVIDASSGWSCTGAFYDGGAPRVRSWSGTTGNEMRKMGFKAERSNSIYNATAGANVVRPTSTVIHVYKRSN